LEDKVRTSLALFNSSISNNYFQKNVEKRRASLYKEIDQLFKDHEGRDHLVLKHRVFVDARDKNDPEI
jgi:Flp pilus assembly CpaF family ATPase